MNALRKVLVVDSGQRGAADLLSTELAELGLSSVTTSVEAADVVLEVIARPSAIFLNMPSPAALDHDSFVQLAASLRSGERTSGIPVIQWSADEAHPTGDVSAVIRTAVGPQALTADL